MNTTVGIALLTVEPGEVTLAFQPQAWHYNIIGIVHGGMICTIADTAMAMAMAVLSRLPSGLFPTTTDNQTRFYRPVTTDTGIVRCLGTVQYLGRRTAAARAEVRDAQGRLTAQATTTCLIGAPPPRAPMTDHTSRSIPQPAQEDPRRSPSPTSRTTPPTPTPPLTLPPLCAPWHAG
ncbi:PaaI family thioesterase [Streptomyces roseifaciens]|uniref:PaaI family thioesterase n=1 Tax=Streptomyces roseifaciens TaxID=1488406 RepID=UPI000717F352|nr:PaaI family thioesterase [Streptomyces roseifaciens]